MNFLAQRCQAFRSIYSFQSKTLNRQSFLWPCRKPFLLPDDRKINILPVRRNYIHGYDASEAELLDKARDLLFPLGEGNVHLCKDEDSGIATITLQHEQKKNALSGRMMVAMADVVTELVSWTSGRGVILQSEGDFFCSGGDLSTVSATLSPKEGYLMATLMHDTLTRLHNSPLVSVCVVHGRAMGGGAELVTTTDFRLFTTAGEVKFVQGVMGVSPGWGGGTRLVKLLGRKVALDLLLTARTISGVEALRLGFADAVLCDEGDRYEQVEAWLKERVKFEPEIVHTLKNLTVSAAELNTKESLEVERSLFAPLWGGPANLKALGKKIKH